MLPPVLPSRTEQCGYRGHGSNVTALSVPRSSDYALFRIRTAATTNQPKSPVVRASSTASSSQQPDGKATEHQTGWIPRMMPSDALGRHEVLLPSLRRPAHLLSLYLPTLPNQMPLQPHIKSLSFSLIENLFVASCPLLCPLTSHSVRCYEIQRSYCQRVTPDCHHRHGHNLYH